MPETIVLPPDHLKHKVLKGLAIAVGIMALSLSILNIYLEQYSLTAIEWVLTYLCWFVYRKIELNQLTYLQSLIVPYFLAFVIIYGTFLTPVQNGLFIWSFIVPTIFYLLYGKDHGFWAAFIIGSIQVTNILLKGDSELYNSERLATNFALAYITIWVVSRTYEISRAKSQNALQELALKDSLTGAFNRLALKKHFNEKAQSSKHLSLVILDLDFFKKINDRYGHEAGDCVLLEFTKLMQKTAGENSVFRLGGEEFCLLLEDPVEEAKKIAEKLKSKMLETQIPYKNDLLQCTFSAGISSYQDNKSLSELLAEADNNLYQAKHMGRNQIVAN